MKLEKGQVQVYTGNGKGKTTAALGLSLRALGHGLRVCMVQFMKGGGPYGEHRLAQSRLDGLTIHTTGRKGWVTKGAPSPDDLDEARRGLGLAEVALSSRYYDLVVLDEINGAVDFGLLGVEEVLRLIAARPPQVELVLTGRNAPSPIIDAADLVSEVREVKHYFSQGVNFRVGIER
ncbi:MAG: cob(I)yrinic acid a,c-diamide adenosyltransferase [Desulfuromonadales bacterium]|nr:cob(I)yrinic acid a,c-diamide adenosyltransferase [Desulfuromonadales bacterium]NIR34433.1 cob(I)yrinic acid a,c-diamide adenosyltransferase [Desulfuromonadales bacterium]NIS41806.1 cob(I)yrinic acid a,c-diamide adenosyltransferase [Desulfuromonadales bacterium]